MQDTKIIDLEKTINFFENRIAEFNKQIADVILQITPLHQKLELVLNQKLAIKKYSFRNIISFGLFNFFKKKEINQEIKEINQEIGNLMGQISDFDNEQSQIKTKIIENYKIMVNMMSDKKTSQTNNFAKIMKDVSVQTDDVNNKQRINSI